MIATYIVRPRRDGGAELIGPGVPAGAQFADEVDAGDRAHLLGRATGGRVSYLDAAGCQIIAETIEKKEPERNTPELGTPPNHNWRLLEDARERWGFERRPDGTWAALDD